MSEKEVAATGANSSKGQISRRNGLKLVAEGMAASLLPHTSRTKPLGESRQSTLLPHGDADRILPADATSRRQAKMLKNVKFVELKGGPHGVLWTHAEEINGELLKFLA